MRTVPIAWILAPLAFQLAALAFSPADVPQAGQQASEFTLPSQDGTQLGLKDFRGKWVVLYFYPKDNTPGCTIEAHNFQRDLAKYEQDNAVIVGVSVDSTDSHKDFDQYGSLRPNGVAARNTFLIDPAGKITKVWTGVNPAPHSEEVLAALAEMKHK